MRPRTVVLAFSLLLLAAPAVLAKSYSADRFEARAVVRGGGALEVTETIVFRFDGRFTEVFRDIPRRRTDGIDIVRVSMDGTPFSEGSGPGQYDVSRQRSLRVRWHFLATGTSVHTFELTYVARGVVQQTEAGDLLEWQPYPTRHDYAIASSAVTIDLPTLPMDPPSIETRRVPDARVGSIGQQVTIETATIRRDGWVSTSVLLPRESVVEEPPVWQQQRLHAATLVPTWLIAAGTILALGLVLLFGLRQGYDAPNREDAIGPTGADLPDELPPAIAGTLVSNGGTGFEAAMATLFALADRGVLTIIERPGSWGQRHFILKRTRSAERLSEAERVLLDGVFAGRQGPEDEVDLARARGRVMRKSRSFSQAVRQQMTERGLLDPGRGAVRRRFAAVTTACGVLCGAALIPAAVLIDRYGPWTLVVPAALMTLAVIGMIMYAAITPLSDEGIRRARGWRGFQKFLRQVTRDRATIPAESAQRLLPFAIATGLAAAWASYLKKHEQHVPDWFRAVAQDRARSRLPISSAPVARAPRLALAVAAAPPVAGRREHTERIQSLAARGGTQGGASAPPSRQGLRSCPRLLQVREHLATMRDLLGAQRRIDAVGGVERQGALGVGLAAGAGALDAAAEALETERAAVGVRAGRHG